MTPLNKLFSEFAESYPEISKRTFEYNEKTRIITDQVPELLYELLKIKKDEYRIYGSVGNGNWAEIAWVCLLDTRITESTTKGYYVCFLFDSQLKNVYLCLSLGWTQFRDEFGDKEGRLKIRAYCDHYGELLSNKDNFKPGTIDLLAKNSLGKGYDAGTILSKRYIISELESADLMTDLGKIIDIYDELKSIVGDNILNLVIDNLEDNSEIEEFGKELAETTFKVIDEKVIQQMLEKTKNKPRETKERMIKQIVRNRKYATFIKQKNHYVCELCDRKPFIQRNGQPYAEADHIRPLGGPTKGLDSPDNMRCLCAQCHAVITHGSDAEIKGLIR